MFVQKFQSNTNIIVMVSSDYYSQSLLILVGLQGKNAYLRDHWCRFEAIMLLFLFISIVLHVAQVIYDQHITINITCNQ